MARKQYQKAVQTSKHVPISTTVTEPFRKRWGKLAEKRNRPHTTMVRDSMEEYADKYDPPQK